MRAITHVVGKAMRSSRRARRGVGCWLRTTTGASGRTPISSSRSAWRRALAVRRPLTGRASTDGRRGGEGSARQRLGRSRDGRPQAPVCGRLRPRLRSSAHARTAHSPVVRTGSELSSASGPHTAALVAEQKSRAALLLVVRMQASASSRLAVVTHPAPGRCGSRVAAPVRDFYQRSSDDKVPLPSTPLTANSRLAPARRGVHPTTASRARPRRAAPPRRDCSPSPPGWRAGHPRGAQLPRHGLCPGPVGPRRGERVAR